MIERMTIAKTETTTLRAKIVSRAVAVGGRGPHQLQALVPDTTGFMMVVDVLIVKRCWSAGGAGVFKQEGFSSSGRKAWFVPNYMKRRK